jgi:hypothetical protein
MPATYDKIAVLTANGSALTHTFSSIPGTYTDLILIINSAGSLTGGNMNITFNGAATGYSRTFIYGDGTSAVSGRDSNATVLSGGGTNPNGAFVKWNIFDYSNTTTFKTVLMNQIEATRLVVAEAGLYRSTSAITSLAVNTQAAISAGQVLSLYGIKAA